MQRARVDLTLPIETASVGNEVGERKPSLDDALGDGKVRGDVGDTEALAT